MVIYNENGVCLKHYDLKAITLDTTDYSWPYTNIRWKIFTKFIADERIEIHFNNEKQRIYNTNDLDFEVEAK